MPTAPPKACPVCGKAACQEHRGGKASYFAWYTSRRWKKESRAYLDNHPHCELCGRTVYRGPDRSHPRKGHVDHITPHKGNETLFWCEGNWRTLCMTCHGSQGARS